MRFNLEDAVGVVDIFGCRLARFLGLGFGVDGVFDCGVIGEGVNGAGPDASEEDDFRFFLLRFFLVDSIELDFFGVVRASTAAFFASVRTWAVSARVFTTVESARPQTAQVRTNERPTLSPYPRRGVGADRTRTRASVRSASQWQHWRRRASREESSPAPSASTCARCADTVGTPARRLLAPLHRCLSALGFSPLERRGAVISIDSGTNHKRVVRGR